MGRMRGMGRMGGDEEDGGNGEIWEELGPWYPKLSVPSRWVLILPGTTNGVCLKTPKQQVNGGGGLKAPTYWSPLLSTGDRTWQQYGGATLPGHQPCATYRRDPYPPSNVTECHVMALCSKGHWLLTTGQRCDPHSIHVPFARKKSFTRAKQMGHGLWAA